MNYFAATLDPGRNWAILILLLALVAGCQSGLVVQDGTAITNVTVVDVVTGARREGMTVVIAGDRINAVRPSSSVHLSADVREVSGAGKFVIPGLADMHNHLGADYGEALRDLLGWGITTVFNPAGGGMGIHAAVARGSPGSGAAALGSGR